MSRPLLSIVIANYNYGRFLEEAIQSVIAQDMGWKIELIVCDAASADNSAEVIKNFANGLPPNTSYSDWISSCPEPAISPPLISWWCSESDGGQSAAFNKGFGHARGRFLTWLNADDVLMPGTLKTFEESVAKHPHCEWFVGGAMWLDKNLNVMKCACGRKFSAVRAKMGDVHVWGPSSFFSRSLYERAGRIDERYNYMMDTDLWHRFYYKCNATYLPFTDYAWGLRLHEQAKMSAHNFASSGESDPNHPKWAQIRREKTMLEEIYAPSHKMNSVRKLLTMDIAKSLKSRWDTIRYKGRYYLECVK